MNVAELKNQLSAYLHQARAREELLVRDRNIPIAKIIPLQEGTPKETSCLLWLQVK